MFETILAFVQDNTVWIAVCMLLVAGAIIAVQLYTERSMRAWLEEETELTTISD